MKSSHQALRHRLNTDRKGHRGLRRWRFFNQRQPPVCASTQTPLFHSFKWDSTTAVAAAWIMYAFTVLICDGHRPCGNVGHTFMHNNSFRLYSHRQLGRLSFYIFVPLQKSAPHFSCGLFFRQTVVRKSGPCRSLEQSCCPFILSLILLKSHACQWHGAAHNSIIPLEWEACWNDQLLTACNHLCQAFCLCWL